MLLSVYEIKGTGLPRDLPAEGLEGIWPEQPFYYLFYRFSAKDMTGPILEWLKLNPGWQLTSRYDLPYEKWQDISASQIELGPFRIAASPRHANEPGTTEIIIDPGVVFGSGVHPTTQGCLLAISEIFGAKEVHTAVDFGAGTGILAIACALAGAKSVLAIDRNPLALDVASRNARKNGVEAAIAFVQADGLGCLDIRPDLLVMNVEWPILEKMLDAGEWRNARRVVLAGFLESKLESVKRYASPEFLVDKVIEREGWPVLILVFSG